MSSPHETGEGRDARGQGSYFPSRERKAIRFIQLLVARSIKGVEALPDHQGTAQPVCGTLHLGWAHSALIRTQDI